MLSYWVLAVAGLGRAIQEYIRSRFKAAEGYGSRRQLVLTVLLAVIAVLGPIALKAASWRWQMAQIELMPKLSHSPSGNCRTQLANPDKSLTFSKPGSAGELSWLFCLGNRYEWKIDLSISADDAGAAGTSSVVGETSPWYSFRGKKREAQAQAGARVSCEQVVAGCMPVALPDKDSQFDGDFVAAVEAVSDERAGGAIVQVDVSASVSGSGAVGSLSIGLEKGPAKAGLDLSTPNDARDAARKSKSFFYRCVRGS